MFSMFSNFRILIGMGNCSFVFFYPGNECSVSFTIIHEITILTADFVHNSISLFGR